MTDDRAYRILITFDAEAERFEGRVPELEVSAKGDTRAQAIENVESEIEAKVAAAAGSEEGLPPPADTAEPEPGEVTVKLAGPLMKDLVYAANRNGMSVDELATQLLFAAVGRLSTEPERRSRPKKSEPRDDDRGNRGRRRGRNNENFRGDIDDQANFLAYVRDMEKGGRRR